MYFITSSTVTEVETKGLNFKLYLAVTIAVYDAGFQKQLARLIVERLASKFIDF